MRTRITSVATDEKADTWAVSLMTRPAGTVIVAVAPLVVAVVVMPEGLEVETA
jgi:hypothetical protein